MTTVRLIAVILGCVALLICIVQGLPVYATIGPVVLAQGSGASPLTTGTLTPDTSTLVIVWTYNQGNNFNTISGTNGFNVTWTAVRTQGADAGSLQFNRGIPSSTTPGTITVTETTRQVAYIVVAYSGVNTTTNQGIVQSNITFNNGTIDHLATTLGAYGNVNNATIYGGLINKSTTFSAATNYTTVATQTANTNSVTMAVAHRVNQQDLAPDGGTFGTTGAMVAGSAEMAAIVTQRIKVRQ